MANTRVVDDDSGEFTDLPDVLLFMQLLWAVAHGLERISKRMTGDIGVTGPQRLVLRVVGLYPGMSAGDLATVLHVHPSTSTSVLQRPGDARTVNPRECPRDRRRAALKLTKNGAKANAVRHGTVEGAIAEALGGIGDRDRVASRRVLERLAQHLGTEEPVTSHRRSRSRTTRTSR